MGQFRTNQVWLGNRDGRRAIHIQPPAASNVEKLINTLCDDWNSSYLELNSKSEKLLAIATFHANFLVVHPFLDGNGRVARAILMQQCLDLFGVADMSLMNKGADYYSALQAADAGSPTQLVSLIEPVVGG